MIFKVERITTGSTGLLTTVLNDVFDDPLSEDRLAKFVAQNTHCLFVALDGDVVVGQVRGMLHHQPDGPSELYVDNLGVAPFYQQRGIARALMDALEAWGKAQGASISWVLTEGENASARALYSKRGFACRAVTLFEKD